MCGSFTVLFWNGSVFRKDAGRVLRNDLFESGVGGNQVLPVGKDPRQLYRALRVDPELSKGVFSLGEQLGRRKVWHKSRQGASVFLADRAAGAEEEAGNIN